MSGNYSLTKGKIEWMSQSASGFLNGLAGWPKKEYGYLSEKIFKKSEELASNVLDKHFVTPIKLNIIIRREQTLK